MEIFVWKCCNCEYRVMTRFDCQINERPICVQCNAEMTPQHSIDKTYNTTEVSFPPT